MRVGPSWSTSTGPFAVSTVGMGCGPFRHWRFRGVSPVCPARFLSIKHSAEPAGEPRPLRARLTGTSRLVALRVLDDAVGARVEQALVAVREAHEVGRRTVAAPHLDDLAEPIRAADRAPVDVDPVTDDRTHAVSSVRGEPHDASVHRASVPGDAPGS